MKSIKKIFKSRYGKNFLTLFSGSFMAQLIPFLISPILTRLYSPEDMGVFFLFTSSIILLSIISTLQYEASILLPEKDEDSINLLAVSIFISFSISILILLLTLIFHNNIQKLFNDTSSGFWLYLLAPSIFIGSVIQTINLWNNRKKEFHITAGTAVVRSTSISSIQMIFGFFTIFRSSGLILGNLIGQVTTLLLLLKKVLKKYQEWLKYISFKEMKRNAKIYSRIPLFNTLLSFSNTLANQIPIFLLSRFYGLTTASFYGLSNRIIGTPLGLIGQSVGQLFMQEGPELNRQNKKNIIKYIKRVYSRLFLLAIIPMLFFFFLSPTIFRILFGEEWVTAGIYSQLLIPWLFIGFLNSSISNIVTILKRQHQMLILDLIFLFLRITAIFLGYRLYYEPYYSILFFAAVGFIYNVIVMIYYIKIAKSNERI